MNTLFIIKQYDLLPRYEFTLLDEQDEDLVPVDLSYALSARLLMRNLRTGLKVDQPVVLLDQSDPDNHGKGYYEWRAGDTDTPGKYDAEVEVMWANGKPQTFPANKYATVKIIRDLNNSPQVNLTGTGSITAAVAV